MFLKRPLDDLALVGSMGVAGGIIGLSTLSFGGKSRQVVAGISLGIISGIGWVAYSRALDTRDNYEDLDSEGMGSMGPFREFKADPPPMDLMVTWNWQF